MYVRASSLLSFTCHAECIAAEIALFLYTVLLKLLYHGIEVRQFAVNIAVLHVHFFIYCILCGHIKGAVCFQYRFQCCIVIVCAAE